MKPKFKIFTITFFRTLLLCACGTLLFLIPSCKKEYTPFPYAAIERFEVSDGSTAATKLKAIIEGDEIYFSWPPFVTVPDSISPEITVSDRATVSPVSGTKVAFKESTEYTVTAQDGTVRKYTLKPASNEPIPTFNLRSVINLRLGGQIVLDGEYLIADTNRTKVYLVDQNKKQTQVPGNSFLTLNSAMIQGIIPLTIDTGLYSVRLVTDANKVKTQGPFRVIRPFLTGVVVNDAGKSVKRGNSITVSLTGPTAKFYDNDFKGSTAILYLMPNYDEIRIPVTIPVNGTLNIVLPVTAQLGKIGSIYFEDKNGNYIYSWEAPAQSEVTIVP
ncbi:hypothetical protein J7E50_02825 [Pedobacter sp. ISL-68]|uniref:DUF5018 domain-containing protein n=1 Tax=unclassified Pedobacter TaxID=2628915 RepID=UPI001BE6A751|nr:MULTISPECIES: DUF5018 domain-containing protein [unclassified Pedobacter]MBT2560154.1 hypothetical protein [Pedobacter sp. ISL-64]MBT2589133.1 hypothetical protein [Pedobacter sp. ISL-68]